MKNKRYHMNSRGLIHAGLALALSMMMAAALIPAPGKAAEKTEEREKEAILHEISKGKKRENPFSYDGKVPTEDLKAAEEYPSSFDLRNVDGRSYVTPVRIQNPFGTCWGFSATAAAESSILADDALNTGLDPETFDLSEKHLAWFSVSHLQDSSDPQNGEGIYFIDDDNKARVHYNSGGETRFATFSYAAGIGPVLESSLPYRGTREEVASWYVATAYDKEDNPLKYEYKDVWYSDEDDWTIPESKRYGNRYRLKDSFILPSPAEITVDKQGKKVYSFNKAGVDAIKEQLIEHHRAVSIAFSAESFLPGQDTSGKNYMSSNWAHYTWKTGHANHAVTVVGWDDNYPKENFLKDHQPEGNGAFLIKNSWGSECNDFPNNGYRHWGLLEGQDGIPYDKNARAVSDRATGYFWISYYDQSLEDPETFSFDKANDTNGYYVEQHDLLLAGEIDTFCKKDTKSANVFQAEATSELSGISVLTTTPGTEVFYDIYLLRGGYTGPEDGTKLTEGKESFKYGGYHRIELDPSQQAVLSKGQYYSVIVTEKSPEGENYVPYTNFFEEKYCREKGYDYYSKTVINPGESYLCCDGIWMDLSAPELQDAILGEEDCEDYNMDNFPIKSYLEPVLIEEKVFSGYLKVSHWQQGSPGTFDLELGDDPLTVTAEFRGTKSGDSAIKANVIWSTSDPSVFTVEPQGNNTSRAVVTIKDKTGTAYLTADAGQYGRRVVGIMVTDPNITEEPKPDEEKTGDKTDDKSGDKSGDSSKDKTEEKTGTKKDQDLTVKATPKKISYKKLSKKKQTVSALKVSGAKGKVTYKKVSVSKKKYASGFAVNKNTGKITVKKKTKKGTYKIKVKVSAAGDASYNPAAKSAIVKITIK